MSRTLTISAAVMAFAKPVTLDIDLTLFGPRQKTAFLKMLKTGYCKGVSVPSRVAQMVR